MLPNKAFAPTKRSASSVLWIWLLSAALAFGAEEALLRGRMALSGILFLVAVALALAALALGGEERDVVKTAPPPPDLANSERPGPLVSPLARRLIAYATLSLGVISVGFATIDELRDGATASAGWVWGAGLIMTVLGSYLLTDRRPFRAIPDERRRWLEVVAVVSLIGFALLLRLPDLSTIPFQVHGDEASVGLDARRILAGTFPDPFSVGWFDVPFMSFAIPAAFLRFLGDDLFSLRFASVLQGVGSILLIYLLTKRLFSTRAAFIAAFLLAVAHWHIHYSRTGFHYMQALFAGLLLYWLFERGLQRRDPFSFLLAGFAAGLCVVVYYSARLAPVILVAYVAHRAITQPGFLRTHRRGLTVFVMGTVLFVAPIAAFFSAHPETLNSRGRDVFLLNRDTLSRKYSETGVTRLEDLLAIQARKTLLAFNQGSDLSLQYGFQGPLLDRWTAALMVLGVAIIVFRWRISSYFLLAAWIFLTLFLGGIMTIDAPFSPRILTVLPALVIAAALAVDTIWLAAQRALPGRGQLVAVTAIALLGSVTAWANYVAYFDGYTETTHNYDSITEASYFMDHLSPDSYVLYLNPNATIEYETTRFLAPEIKGEDRSAEFGEPGLKTDGIAGRPVFLLLGDYTGKLAELQERYPGGETVEGSGVPARFIAYFPPS